jgi:3D (Asp-Asp-Asp) domain-containing protein
MTNKKGCSVSSVAAEKKPSSLPFSWAVMVLLFGLPLLPGCAKKTACLVEQDPATLSCSPNRLFETPPKLYKTLDVTAMAYSAKSLKRSIKSPPRAANGTYLTDSVNAIAVSPDLLESHGLRLDQKIRLVGLEGEYVVMDVMSPRHTKSIDIYFGSDHSGALQWGKRPLTIAWD